MLGGNIRIALVGIGLIAIGAAISLVDPHRFWRVNLVVFESIFIIAGIAAVVIGSWKMDDRFPLKKRLVWLEAIAVVVIVALASYAILLVIRHNEPLREDDGAVTLEIQNLPGSYYRDWSDAWLVIYSGEPIPVEDPHLIVYPFDVGWRLNSSTLMETRPAVHDFGARNANGTWLSLTVTDVKGDGAVGDGDRLKVYSQNGSFSEDTEYFMEFGVGGPIAPFYVIYGFEFSNNGFDSWVKSGPVEWAM